MNCSARDELQRYAVDILEDIIWADVSGYCLEGWINFLSMVIAIGWFAFKKYDSPVILRDMY